MHHHIRIIFEQPLYWKAAKIIMDAANTFEEERLDAARLLHTFMNMLAVIGTLMEDRTYYEHTVLHMMTLKSLHRAFRGHMLRDRCLYQTWWGRRYDHWFRRFGKPVVEEMYSSMLAGDISLESLLKTDTVTKNQRETGQKEDITSC